MVLINTLVNDKREMRLNRLSGGASALLENGSLALKLTGNRRCLCWTPRVNAPKGGAVGAVDAWGR